MDTKAKAVTVEILSVRLLALDAASTDHGMAIETAMICATAISSVLEKSSLIKSQEAGQTKLPPKSPLTKSEAQRATVQVAAYQVVLSFFLRSL